MNNNDSSEEETFINVNEIIKDQLNPIYQIQLNNQELIIKHIGNGSHAPDFIIKDSFGKNNNLSLYSCVYTDDDFDLLKHNPQKNFLPIVKLIEKKEKHNNVYTISVKIYDFVDYNKIITNFKLFLTLTNKNGYIQDIELDKNINSLNIVEKMIENIIDLEIEIL